MKTQDKEERARKALRIRALITEHVDLSLRDCLATRPISVEELIEAGFERVGRERADTPSDGEIIKACGEILQEAGEARLHSDQVLFAYMAWLSDYTGGRKLFSSVATDPEILEQIEGLRESGIEIPEFLENVAREIREGD
jgi:hypothetical protein